MYEDKVAVVIGSAACLWDDLDVFEEIAAQQGWDWDAVAVNHSGLAVNHPIEHWVSCHPILIHHFREARRCYTHHTLGARAHGSDMGGGDRHRWELIHAGNLRDACPGLQKSSPGRHPF